MLYCKTIFDTSLGKLLNMDHWFPLLYLFTVQLTEIEIQLLYAKCCVMNGYGKIKK